MTSKRLYSVMFTGTGGAPTKIPLDNGDFEIPLKVNTTRINIAAENFAELAKLLAEFPGEVTSITSNSTVYI